jgi:ferric iron reductase protein FhuF
VTGDEVVDAVTATVGHLRIAVGPPDDGWLSSRDLLDDADALCRVVAGTAAGRGTDRQDVAMSLFVQAYSYRVASAAIGGWLVADVVLDVSPANTAITLGRHRPNGLLLREARLVAGDDPLAELQRVLVEDHLAPLVASIRSACRIGEALLWGNVASSVASSFGAFMDPLAHRRAEVRHRLESFLAAARPELANAGRVVPVGGRWAWERRSCCLWYRTDGGSLCADCSLWSEDERRQRYATALAEEDGTP